MAFDPNPRPELKKSWAAYAQCDHCMARTLKIKDQCLQCIADGGSCCSLKQWNRWS